MPVNTPAERPLVRREFATRASLDRALAADIAAQLRRALAARGNATLAVSGGSTPAGMLAQLATGDVDWSRVTVTLVDDRWVPPTHADSNAAMLARTLLTGPAAAARFVPLVDAGRTPQAALADAERALAALPWPLDVAILGMGNDAHTASLFPCADDSAAALAADCPRRLAIVHPRTAPHARITLTLPALAAARCLWLHIVGARKGAVLDDALARTPPRLPIARVLAAGTGDVRVYRSDEHA